MTNFFQKSKHQTFKCTLYHAYIFFGYDFIDKLMHRLGSSSFIRPTKAFRLISRIASTNIYQSTSIEAEKTRKHTTVNLTSCRKHLHNWLSTSILKETSLKVRKLANKLLFVNDTRREGWAKYHQHPYNWLSTSMSPVMW